MVISVVFRVQGLGLMLETLSPESNIPDLGIVDQRGGAATYYGEGSRWGEGFGDEALGFRVLRCRFWGRA